MILEWDEGKGPQENGVKQLSQITTLMLVTELKLLLGAWCSNISG